MGAKANSIIKRQRGYNYEIIKGMTPEQKIEYYNTAGTEAEQEIQRRKATQRKMIINA